MFPGLAALENARRVLIVDDTVDSGKTLLAASEAVRRAIGEDVQIRTAVITSTWRNPPVRADYCLYDRTLVRFPWSFDAVAE